MGLFKKRPAVERELQLSDREFMILCALQSDVRKGLYGLDIQRIVKEEHGYDIPLGSLYVTLGRLVKKGHVDRVASEPESADFRRQYYRLARSGSAMLAARTESLGALLAARGVR